MTLKIGWNSTWMHSIIEPSEPQDHTINTVKERSFVLVLYAPYGIHVWTYMLYGRILF